MRDREVTLRDVAEISSQLHFKDPGLGYSPMVVRMYADDIVRLINECIRRCGEGLPENLAPQQVPGTQEWFAAQEQLHRAQQTPYDSQILGNCHKI